MHTRIAYVCMAVHGPCVCAHKPCCDHTGKGDTLSPLLSPRAMGPGGWQQRGGRIGGRQPSPGGHASAPAGRLCGSLGGWALPAEPRPLAHPSQPRIQVRPARSESGALPACFL